MAASRAFWVKLGGTPRPAAGAGPLVIAFPDVEVHLSPGARSGGTEGSVVNHVAFRVPSFAAVEAAGLMVARLQQFPGVGSVMSPEGERIELFEDAATNLTFTPDSGPPTGIALRHRQPVGKPIAFHHIHLYLPDPSRGRRRQGVVHEMAEAAFPASARGPTPWTCPGVNFNFSVGPKAVVPLKDRTLNHLAFEVRGLGPLCTRLAAEQVDFARPCAGPNRRRSATIVDPCGISIELTEPTGRS